MSHTQVKDAIAEMKAERDSLRAVNAELLKLVEDAAVLADFAECWITDPAIEGMSRLKGRGDKFRAAIASARKQKGEA